VINALVFVLEHPSVKEAVNLAAPEAVTMKSFCAILGGVMSRPSGTFVPSFALRLALGEMAEMLLTGQRAIPKKLLDAGLAFQHLTLEQALTLVLRK
jgi:NAD dependent epimerase/dehydratase family enzyme